MKIRRKLLAMAVLAGTLSALLVASGVAVGTGLVYGEIGKLDLFANDADGDGFNFIPVGDTEASATEMFTANNRGRITESDDDLVTLTPDGPGSGGQLYVGLKDHLFGVKAQGEGNGTPASQINDSGDDGETLTIELGSDVPGSYAWYAQFGLKFKFGAKVRIQAFDDSGPVGDPAVETCLGGDCGPDSGNDRILLTVGEGDATTLFTKVVISIDAPSDGAVSLLDDPGAGFDTFFDIVEVFDGVLACDDFVSTAVGDVSGEFTRLNTTTVTTECGTLKVYNLRIVDGEVQFVPDPPDLAAIYRGDLAFPAGTPLNPLSDDLLEYDQDGLGPANFELMQWCNLVDADGSEVYPTGHPKAEQLYFPELAGLGGEGVDAFPTLAGLMLENGLPPTSCIVAFSTVQGGDDDWVVYLEGDPFYRG